MYELYDVSVLRRTTLPVGYFWDFLKFDDIVPNKNIFVMMDKLYGINNEFYRFLKKQSNNICIEKDFNTYKSLYKYLNRLCFRTTPLYDSSIVCTIITDPLKNLDLDTIDYKPYFYCKASYDWIYSLVDLIEEDENVLFCLKAKINNYCYCRNDIIVNLDSSSSDVQCSETFLKTSVLDYIFTNYTEEFLLDDLFNDLTSMYSSRGDKFIKNFIKTLVQKKVIISELREVPVNINLDYIVNILKKIKNNKYVYEVERINKFIKLINFKKLNIGYCEKLLSMMSAVCRVKEPLIYFLKDSVSGDLSNVYAEINEFVKFMTKNVITDNETMRLKFIKDKFISKYGSNVAINIRLVLDDIFGVNRDIKVEYNIKQLTSSANYFKQKIIDSINSAIVLGNDYVDISDISISKKIYELDSDTKDFFPLSSSFSLSFYIQNNQLMLSNMIGSNLGLNFFNRFKEVEDSFLDKFYELEEYYTENSYLIVQISELLRNYKINNVADNSSTYSNIFCKGGFSPGKFSLEDIYVAYDTNLDRLVIISKKYNKRIKFVLDSMLNIECCSEIVKLLLDISYGYEIHLTELINIISDIELPYIPTLKFKNIVVSNETWKLSSSYFEIDSFEKFEKSFFELKRKFKIVRYIYLLEGDRSLFFDLDKKSSLKVMFKHIKSHYKDRISTLIFKNGNYFKDNTEHINEIVIPFLNTTKYNYEFKVNKNSFVDFKEYNSKLKNSKDYCYVKIYSKKNLLKDFVVPKLFEFLEENQVFTLNKFWFYIVYYDDFGGDHLRLRVKSKEKVLLQKFVSNMLNSNLVSNIIEDVYVDESERYGSTVLIKKVEEIFNLDSIFSINANVYNKQDDMILISTYNYFTSFYSESEFERMYIDNIDRNKLKKIYRDMESHIEELLLNFNKLDSNSKNLLEKISYKIKMYKDAVELCEERDELTNSKFDIVSSIIHMGFNRMFFDRNKEEEYFYVVLHYIFKNINKSKYVNKEGLRYGLFE